MLPIELKLLLLILIANGIPVIATAICGQRGARTLDGGRRLDDGQRLWGDSKTWRGLLLALSVTSLAASALGLPAQIGIIIGAAAMAGDLLSSFIKRRLGMASSSMALGLDQIPESLLPLLAVAGEFGLTWTTIILITLGFVVAELALSQVLFRLGVRNRPY
ncbi:MAG: CDP-archaeol synthase [Candidatus Contendobacter sp.]|nr:CDP-archaeol synthase [Gammaproteobacteria bacterium]MCC8993779.1 CDP-archaeol synthase [Candidatus Contendobacter sp.]